MSDVHVRVRVGAERYAIPVAHVLEIGDIGDLSVAPGSSHALLGLRNLRGDVLPVFDLAVVLGSPRGDAARRMVVAEREGTRAGFAVDEVTDVDAFDAAGQEADSDLLSSAVLLDGSLVGVIDVDRLFERLEAAA
jgi:chemotaxis signal transduction protein